MRDFEKKLYTEFPYFFDQKRGDTPFKYQGFAIDAGWYELVRELAQKIEAEARIENRTVFGWPKCAQLKEKFGLLRCYIDNGSPAIYELAREYEIKSGHICINCGEPGELYRDGWFRVLCTKCEAAYQARIK